MKKYALVIGVGEYESSNLDNLSKVVTGAEELAKVLAAYGNYKVVERLPKKWNQETKSGEITNKEVTKDEVIKALKTLLWERGNKSEVLIYFAGHGIRVKDELGRFRGFLAPSDCEIDLKDGEVVKQENAIGLDILNDSIADQKCEVSSLVMLLDCCYSVSRIPISCRNSILSS